MRRSLVLVPLCAAALAAAPATATAHDRPGGGGSAGTVSAFADGALTIAMSDGSTVTGRVDARTDIVCIPTGWDKRRDRPHHRKARTARDDRRRHRGDRGHHRGHHRPFRCDTGALTAGTVVRAADLRVTATGLVFDDVALIRERSAG